MGSAKIPLPSVPGVTRFATPRLQLVLLASLLGMGYQKGVCSDEIYKPESFVIAIHGINTTPTRAWIAISAGLSPSKKRYVVTFEGPENRLRKSAFDELRPLVDEGEIVRIGGTRIAPRTRRSFNR